MPTYTAHCDTCDTYIEYVRKVADRNDTPICHEKPTVKIIEAPMVGAQKIATGGVYDEGRKKWLEGAKDIDKHLKATGSVTVEEGRQEAQLQRDRTNKAYRKTMRETVSKALYKAANN